MRRFAKTPPWNHSLKPSHAGRLQLFTGSPIATSAGRHSPADALCTRHIADHPQPPGRFCGNGLVAVRRTKRSSSGICSGGTRTTRSTAAFSTQTSVMLRQFRNRETFQNGLSLPTSIGPNQRLSGPSQSEITKFQKIGHQLLPVVNVRQPGIGVFTGGARPESLPSGSGGPGGPCRSWCNETAGLAALCRCL